MNREQQLKWVKIVALALIVVVIIYYFAIHKSSAPARGLPPTIVTVAKPQLLEIGEYVTQTGNTVAINSVNLVARVEGYLDSIKFTDGTFVKKGQPLFIIEPDTYLEKVDEAEASVAAAKASYQYNKAEYARQKEMYKENATSLKNVEKYAAQLDQSQADVAKEEASLKIAQINYGYTHVDAPFNGRIGRHLIDVGNLVGHGQATNLATIDQVDPIYVYFNLNELDLIRLRTAARARGIKPTNLNSIPVFVKMQTETQYKHKGTLDFVNISLNASTGTMELRALLPNKDYDLVPGLFVQVRIPIATPVKQLAIPDTVVQYDQIGSYVLVADANNVVVTKRVELGGNQNGMRAIIKGLTAQDNVIINGVQNASPGVKVTIQDNK